MSHHDFKDIIALRGYHVYQETAWSDAKVNDKIKIEIETNQSSIAIDPCTCAVKAKRKRSDDSKKVVHVPSREKFRRIFTYSSKKKVEGSVVM